MGTVPEQEEKLVTGIKKFAVTRLSAKMIFSDLDIVERDKFFSFGK